ncbi:MAG: hypothetical protein MK171_11970, partial [Pirellulales bacterium]|nr:hypothetical protein [Pirellulales bacterium]
MASSILHIKDSYYFEVPKALKRSHRESRDDFPEFWVRLDENYQSWEAERLLGGLVASQAIDTSGMPAREELLEQFDHWRHGNANFAKPMDVFLEQARGQDWFQEQLAIQSARQAWQDIKAKAEDVEAYKATTP